MSKIDIAIVLILALGGFLGYKRGFLMELFFLVAIVAGVFIGFRLTGAGVEYLQKHFNADRSFLPYLSFLIIFIGVVILVIWLGRSVKNSVDKTFLGRVDELAGAFIGLLKYAFCLSVLFWLAASLHYIPPSGWVNGSWLYPRIEAFAPKIASFLGGFLPFFKEIFRQF